MEDETSHSELIRLVQEQNKARQDETFGGLSKRERDEYDTRAVSIRELESSLGKKKP